MNNKKNILVFVGTYHKSNTQKKCELNEGIYVFRMNPKTGELILLNKGIGEPNPSYVILDQSKRYLYATNEIKEYKGFKSGSVSAFSLNPESGKLTLLNSRATGGADPCHLMVNNSNTHLLVANYTGGSVCVLPFASDGSLESVSCFLQHKGKSVNEKRQTGPHAHSIVLDKSNKLAFVPDLGCDKVYIYKTDFKNGHLAAYDPPYIETKSGAGPRHCIFHPSGKYFYVINELDSSICSYRYDQNKGKLILLQVLSTLPDTYTGYNICAAIKILPDCNYLYGSNRGHDSVATYKIDNNTGKLTLVSIQSTGGNTPRDFSFDHDGNYMLAANQASNNIVVFKVNRETGVICEVFRVNNVFGPTCIQVYSMD